MDVNWGNSNAFFFGDSYSKKSSSDANSSFELSVSILFVMFSCSGGLVNFSYLVTHCLHNFWPGNTSLNHFFFSVLALSRLITYELYYFNNEILKCCNIYQPFSQVLPQKTVHDGSKLWTHYPFPPIIWLSKEKYIANRHQASWYFLFLSVEHREFYHKVYLKAFQNHRSLQSLAGYWN